MGKKEVLAVVEKIPIEEKLKMLSEPDKVYIIGCIERAVMKQRKRRNERRKMAIPAREAGQ